MVTEKENKLLRIVQAPKAFREFLGELLGRDSGAGVLRVAKATFNPEDDHGVRNQAGHGLGVTLPAGAIVVGGFVDVVETFTSTNSDGASIAIHVEAANDIVSAIAISNSSNSWDEGQQDIIPKANTPESTGIKLTAAREITATSATRNLTGGKFHVFLYYVLSE